MTYTELASAALIVAAVLDLWLLSTRLLLRRAFWTAYVILLAFQLIVNGVLTGVPIVRYSRHTIVGLRLAYAPVEDLAFGFALILTTLACWVALLRRGNRRAAADQERRARSADR